MKPWSILSSIQTFKDRFLSVRTDKCEREDGHIVEAYHVLEFTDWVTVIPITDAGEIVLVREYRHASGKVMVGLPGGIMDDGEDSAEFAGARELREETGYICCDWVKVGACYANPALQENKIHYYLGFGAELTAAQDLDPNEEIEVVKMPYSEFLNYGEQDVQHGLHAAALFYTEQYFAAHPDKRPQEVSS
jgi:8-oxo-dGTP pyrophosphatase MutT (NUDIX family)